MGKDDPVTCFNGSECCYDSGTCALYEYRTGSCRMEPLKSLFRESFPQKVPFVKNQDGSVESPERAPTPFKRVAPVAQATQQTAFSPTATQFTSARDLVENTNGVSIRGTIIGDPVSKEANTQRGPKTVESFMVATDTGDVRVSLWEAGGVTNALASGDQVAVEGLSVKAKYDGLPQVSGNEKTKITVTSESGAPRAAPPQSAAAPQRSMTAGIKWLLKGNEEAPPDAPSAFAFVFKYDAKAKKATDKMRDEVTALVGYLDAHGGSYTDGIYDYKVGKDSGFLNRYFPHKEKK